MRKSINFDITHANDLIENNLTFTTSSPNTTVDSSVLSSINLSYSFQFWFYLCFEIPSIIGYLFVFAYLFTQKDKRQAFHHQSTNIVLIFAFIMVTLDFSLYIDSFNHNGKVRFQSFIFCSIWNFIDYSLFNSSGVIIAWASFERHIFIFHSHLFSTKSKRFFFHYLPLTFILLYSIIFYIYAIYFPPCETEYDFTLPACGGEPCYLAVLSLGTWDSIMHGITPVFLIVLFNIALLVRVICQRRNLHRRQNWKKYQKMTFELFSIVILHLTFNLPFMIIVFVNLLGYPHWGSEVQQYIFFLSVLIPYLLPFVYGAHMSQKWLKIKTFFYRRGIRIYPAIAVTTSTVRPRKAGM
ncbi:unnamed protein product [Adineta ricciae]|uniref:G-protein coupled receptors family 1 profile domain-containing protein n=1 Tax=Adineta ricciae TaxID=249248 RepID=A0A815SD24_ADIRI|nr:unnamed protein product [Adineta ricciae]CAF1491120.1 unnamed protein product [Adineta ricciae]